ncbi:hypothetical protein K435DRAFT_867907 [Dendrothele bispora CBS 962.96]|uniref:Uncharacterized protein n=1 Tax=Dendrothele bispora (strain CBS 962.96) TaxID=1314807 RepID=A0A4S8LDJ9_DENBC|nr:hypothetical protein K435DRAFT_867907 [Dendrothele bispora CBS 962.96]
METTTSSCFIPSSDTSSSTFNLKCHINLHAGGLPQKLDCTVIPESNTPLVTGETMHIDWIDKAIFSFIRQQAHTPITYEWSSSFEREQDGEAILKTPWMKCIPNHSKL